MDHYDYVRTLEWTLTIVAFGVPLAIFGIIKLLIGRFRGYREDIFRTMHDIVRLGSSGTRDDLRELERIRAEYLYTKRYYDGYRNGETHVYKDFFEAIDTAAEAINTRASPIEAEKLEDHRSKRKIREYTSKARIDLATYIKKAVRDASTEAQQQLHERHVRQLDALNQNVKAVILASHEMRDRPGINEVISHLDHNVREVQRLHPTIELEQDDYLRMVTNILNRHMGVETRGDRGRNNRG